MKAKATRPKWNWVRCCIAVVIAGMVPVVAAVGAVGILMLSVVFSGSEWDSELEPALKAVESTLAAHSFLQHIRGERNIRIKSITPGTFTGSYGYYFVSYSVETERVPDVIASWKDREDATGGGWGHYSYTDDERPTWWQDESEQGVMLIAQFGAQERQVHGVSVWCNESKGIFYLFFSWGH